jgi:hypothetical protein
LITCSIKKKKKNQRINKQTTYKHNIVRPAARSRSISVVCDVTLDDNRDDCASSDARRVTDAGGTALTELLDVEDTMEGPTTI